MLRNVPLTMSGNGFSLRVISVRQAGLSHRLELAGAICGRCSGASCVSCVLRPLTTKGVDAP